jgi:hypothetical protein
MQDAPWGMDADDRLAALVPCEAADCGAQPGEPCAGLNRKREVYVQPWAHPQRAHRAKAAVAAGEPQAPVTEAAPGPEGRKEHDHGAEAGIDFAQWTDAQLAAVVESGSAAFKASPDFPALEAEYERRKADGADDGSKARVAAMFARGSGPARAPEAFAHLAAECEACGFHFSKPQRRRTCQSATACQRRQDARAAG